MVLCSGDNVTSSVLQLHVSNTPCTAFITATDKMAAEVMATMRNLGLEVPEQMSVISLEGSELASYTHPRLTAIECQVDNIVDQLFEYTIQLLQQSQSPADEPKKVVGKLVARESVARPYTAPSLGL
ncbi:substrate-binding domain-containing protein [Vibrio sp. 10N.286.52.B1]|uniref:substrate-binding domain-containing protein n=1 Tax=Vibrio sp. 10N.286.52.B1 TaxID=3229712 RepID=UPI00355325FD